MFLNDDRYSRLQLIHWWDQKKVRDARILVLGAGALGNEVLKNLALVGVGRLFVVDFDCVESSNLTRSVLFRADDCGRPKAETAAEAVAQLSPDTHCRAISGNVLTDVGLGLFRDVHVAVSCLDNREARLWVNRQCWKVGTPWIDGGIQELNGVVRVFTPPTSSCYECGMTENDYRLLNLRYRCPMLAEPAVQSGKIPTTPTIASIIGAIQAQETLKIVHGIPVTGGDALVFNGAANRFYRTSLPRRDGCLSHESYPPPVDLPLSANDHTVSDLFAAVRDHADLNGPLELRLPLDLVVSVRCDQCQVSHRIMRPRVVVSRDEAVCPECRELGQIDVIHRVSDDSTMKEEPLRRLGIAPYDVLHIRTSDSDLAVCLADDKHVFA